MKKLWLTACAAALFGFACTAQVQQDSTRNRSNQYRNPPQQSDSTDRIQGNKSTRIHMQTDNSDSLQNQRPQTSGEHLGNEINEMDSAATDSVNNSMRSDQYRTNYRQDVDSAKNEMQNDAEKTRQELRNEGERTGVRLKSDEERVRDENNEEATRRRESMNQDSTRSSNESINGGSTSGNSSEEMNQPLEVVSDKEGPNNEVVYKYHDEMYYVDRDKKEMVKVKDSELKESKSQLMIHEGPVTKDVARKGKKAGRS